MLVCTGPHTRTPHPPRPPSRRRAPALLITMSTGDSSFAAIALTDASDVTSMPVMTCKRGAREVLEKCERGARQVREIWRVPSSQARDAFPGRAERAALRQPLWSTCFTPRASSSSDDSRPATTTSAPSATSCFTVASPSLWRRGAGQSDAEGSGPHASDTSHFGRMWRRGQRTARARGWRP